VRVPTFVCHAVSCNIETRDKVTPEQAREALAKAPGLRVVDDVANLRFPQPIEVAGGNLTHVGRIREDFSIANGLNLWLVSDNVRKGPRRTPCRSRRRSSSAETSSGGRRAGGRRGR